MTTTMIIIAAMLAQAAPPVRVPDAKGGEHPIYRKLQPGEQRSEGLLRRIVCSGRTAITLVVKQKDGSVVQYTAPSIAAVDFIAYDKDFRGPVTCEGFGDGRPVYVTWKPDDKAKRAVAVEFLAQPRERQSGRPDLQVRVVNP
jgi:hypothetical protein